MNMMDEIKRRRAEAEAVIVRYLPEETGFAARLAEAMNYSIQAGGKRIRPILMAEAYRMFGGEGRVIEPFMAAMEMIHTSSLIHDDLPALDDDAYRRGRLTTHKVYGEALGILSGDALLNYAYETAGRAFSMGPQDPAVGRAFSALAQKAGIGGMLGGQSVDVMNEGAPLERGMLLAIYEKKTSALIEASLMVGAILAGAGEEDVTRMEEAGHAIGLAFQIRDDILDTTGTLQEMGKPANSDAKNGKVTYVTLEGAEAAEAFVISLSEEAIAKIQATGRGTPFLKELILYLAGRKN